MSRLRFRARPTRLPRGVVIGSAPRGRGVLSFAGGGGGEGDPALAFPGLPFNWTMETEQHIREDFSQYTTVSDIGVVGRTDGHDPWGDVATSRLSLHTGSVSPWFGPTAKRLRSSVPVGQITGINCGFSEPVGGLLYANFANAIPGSFILHHAWRCPGPNGVLFEGKWFDLTTSVGGINYRWTDESWTAGRMGGVIDFLCDDDNWCGAYYANDGTVPLVAGIKPNAYQYGAVHFHGTNETPTDICEAFFTQNVNADVAGYHVHGDQYTDGTWWLTTIRATMGTSVRGRGRYEVWLTREDGQTWKIMEYLGDAGQFDAGRVRMPLISAGEFFIRPSDGFGGLHFCHPSRNDDNGGWNGGSVMECGGFVVVTHEKMELAA